MIQLNLLPESRLYEVRTKKIYNLITRVTFFISIFLIAVVIGLFLEVKVVQKNNINKYDSQITSDDSALNRVPDLSAILKINDAIKVLPSLYDSRPDTTRLSNYLALVTPANVSIQSLNLNFTTNSFSLSGNADSINTINTFVDTLKFCKYQVGGSSTSSLAFNQVVLSSYSYSASSTSGQVFSITGNFSPQIFATSEQDVSLIVPSQITTRSDIDQPAALFKSSSGS